MALIDYALIVLYFTIIGIISYVSSKKSLADSKSYFLGGGTIGWLAIGASLFASNISAEHFIGLAGSGAASGLAVGQFEWLACFILLLLGWFFVPFYLKTGVFTMPEFLEKRYNSQCRTYLSAVSLLAYIFTKISVAVYAGALVLETILGWNIWIGAIVLLVATGIYTVFGGLRAVIYTELFQTVILITGGIILTIISVVSVGGLSELFTKASPEFFNLWKSVDHPDFPWTGILFGAPILGVWYWCTDQMIVQRTLAAPNLTEARKGTIFAGFLKILPVFILVLPGIAGGLLYPDVEPNKMYATLVNNLLPVGVKGIVVAALLAALMSSLASVFNSSSTLVVMDFYKNFRKNASEKELVRAGQTATVLLVFIGLVWLPFIGIMSNQLFVYLQSVQAYISPPIAAVFLIGLLWKRANGTAAYTSLLTGFILGVVRFVSEIGTKSGWLTFKPLVAYASINFLHFAIFLFAVSVAILAIVSIMTAMPSEKNMALFGSDGGSVAVQSASNKNVLLLSLLLVAVILTCWIVFSPLVW